MQGDTNETLLLRVAVDIIEKVIGHLSSCFRIAVEIELGSGRSISPILTATHDSERLQKTGKLRLLSPTDAVCFGNHE